MYGHEETRTDKHGTPIERYPTATEHGRLLGINVYGNAAYATDQRATLAVLDDRGELRVTPRERWLATEFPLAETGLTPGDYVLYVADEAGPWRVLADAGHEGVADRGVDPQQVVADGPVEVDIGALLDAVATAEGWAERAEPAGELRHAALDHPDRLTEHLGTLLSVLSESAPEGSPSGIDGTARSAGTGSAPEAGYSAMAARGDLAWTLARAVRAEPAAAHERFDELLGVVAAGRGSDADHDRHLLDALDVTGAAEPSATAARFVTALEDEDPAVRRRALDALYRLEHRYAADEHPLLGVAELREAVDSLADDPDEAVREAAEEVRTVHGFHLTG